MIIVVIILIVIKVIIVIIQIIFVVVIVVMITRVVIEGGRALLIEILLPRIAREGTVCIMFNKRTSSKSSN